MATSWGVSWGVSWGHSWDINDNPPPVEVIGGKMLKGELFKPKHAETYDRWYPEAERKQLQKSAKILATVGGHARAAALTPQQRTQIAMKAANARWK